MQIFQGALLAVLATGFLLLGDADADEIKTALEESPRHGEWVKVPTATGRTVNAFVVYPEVKGPATAIIVIHEIFGLTDWIRLVADRLAESGFVAICPDLLSGMGPDGGGTESFASGDEVRRTIRDLSAAQVTSDLEAIENYVRALPSTNEKVAVSGFCWGGGQTFSYAVSSETMAAGFVFYGRAPATEDVPKISAPIYGFYGESDNRINATIAATQAAADAANVTYQPVIYEDVGHAFLRRGMAAEANAAQQAATDAAWERWLALLRGL